jgi:hypothetical protein
MVSARVTMSAAARARTLRQRRADDPSCQLGSSRSLVWLVQWQLEAGSQLRGLGDDRAVAVGDDRAQGGVSGRPVLHVFRGFSFSCVEQKQSSGEVAALLIALEGYAKPPIITSRG